MTSSEPIRILIVNGHPDGGHGHFGDALIAAYAEGARGAGHEVRQQQLSALDFPLLKSQQEWQHGPVPPSLLPAQADILWARHLVIAFPLWLGDMPALLKGFLEQVARPGFALGEPQGASRLPARLLAGRSARILVTMGMPAAMYSLYYRAHSLKSLERNILGFVGIRPVRRTLIGMVEGMDEPQRDKWLQRLREMGEAAG